MDPPNGPFLLLRSPLELMRPCLPLVLGSSSFLDPPLLIDDLHLSGLAVRYTHQRFFFFHEALSIGLSPVSIPPVFFLLVFQTLFNRRVPGLFSCDSRSF